MPGIRPFRTGGCRPLMAALSDSGSRKGVAHSNTLGSPSTQGVLEDSKFRRYLGGTKIAPRPALRAPKEFQQEALVMKLNLSVDEVLTTTRAVRKRLDVSKPVPRA